jgi:hypothetical protein
VIERGTDVEQEKVTETEDVCGAGAKGIDSLHERGGQAQAKGIADVREEMVTFDEQEVKETVDGVVVREIAGPDVVLGRHQYDDEVEIELHEVVNRTEEEASEVSGVPFEPSPHPNERSIPVDDEDVPAPSYPPLASPVPVLA